MLAMSCPSSRRRGNVRSQCHLRARNVRHKALSETKNLSTPSLKKVKKEAASIRCGELETILFRQATVPAVE